MNVLIIDNKKGYARKLKRLLEDKIHDSQANLKYTVLEGLAELRHPHYNILIIGHQMPEISIDELLSILANNGITIPVLIIDHEIKQYDSGDNSLDSCVIRLSADDVNRILPLLVMEGYKRCTLFKENQALKSELKKTQGNQKISEIALTSNHHINNPLMTILGNTQLLIRDCDSSNSNTMARLEKIEKAAKRIQEITLDLANKLGSSAEPREMLKISK